MLVTTSVWKWLLWCNISLWWWTHQNTQVYYFSLQSIFDNIIVWPAYTSLGHGQNFVQKDWVNGLSSHAPDEERIGSTIIFCHINKCGSTEEDKMHPLWWLQGGFQRWGVTRRACGAIHGEGSTQVWCGAIHGEGSAQVWCLDQLWSSFLWTHVPHFAFRTAGSAARCARAPHRRLHSSCFTVRPKLVCLPILYLDYNIFLPWTRQGEGGVRPFNIILILFWLW